MNVQENAVMKRKQDKAAIHLILEKSLAVALDDWRLRKRYFGSRQKIFNVHFRNIRGHRNDFVETYPDEGSVNFVKVMMVYKEVGYPYMMMPDHVPHHADAPSGDQAFAFAYGSLSGAHFNPAVTIGVLSVGAISVGEGRLHVPTL